MEDLLKEPSAAIRAARRRLESISGYELLEDLRWIKGIKCWCIKVRLTCEVPVNEFIPETTEWHIAIDENYPDGTIKFYPDKINGIKATFPHQNYNQETKQAFLSGDPCLNTTQGTWGRNAYSSEPIDQSRLVWHLHRCFDWLKAAASNTLVQQGDPFELPPFPSIQPKYIIAYNEDHNSFRRWSASSVDHGILELKTVGQTPQVYAIFNFLSHQQDTPESFWGKRIASVTREDQTGIWLLANALPVQRPWRIPDKMGDLITVLSSQGIDLHEKTFNLYNKFRKEGKEVRMIVIGFRLSVKFGQSPSLINWLALALPSPPIARGFRDNNKALHKHELNVLLGRDQKIEWIKTENWNKDQLTRRGSVDQTLSNSNIAIMGCGSVGSILAEQLSRLGVEKLTVIDSATLEAGNMSRHVLTISDVGNNKAEALAKRLNSIFPFMNVNFEKEDIEDVVALRNDFLLPFDLVIDATGDDTALRWISGELAKYEKNFVSVSTGYNANKMFCFIRKGRYPDTIFDAFNKVCAPWLVKEKETFAASHEILDGVGCWHPLFPARLDDIQMLVGASVKVIESNLAKESSNSLTVIEKQFNDQNGFSGIKIISQE